MNERSWILKVMLSEFLGLDYVVENAEVRGICIEAEGHALELPDTFFIGAEQNWLKRILCLGSL